VLEVIAVDATLRVLTAGALTDDQRPPPIRRADVLVDAHHGFATRAVEMVAPTFVTVIVAPAIATGAISTTVIVPTISVRERRAGSGEHRCQQRQHDAGAPAPNMTRQLSHV
jgi:hypothetical protein